MPADTAPQAEPAFLEEPRAGRLNIQYRPADGDEVAENPPRFSWLPVIEDEAAYVVRISVDADCPKDATWTFPGVPLNFLTPPTTLPPGRYYWSYAVWDAARKQPKTRWSRSRSFTIAEGCPQVPLADRTKRYASVDMAHPRLWLGPKQLKSFAKKVRQDPQHCAWQNRFHSVYLPNTIMFGQLHFGHAFRLFFPKRIQPIADWVLVIC